VWRVGRGGAWQVGLARVSTASQGRCPCRGEMAIHGYGGRVTTKRETITKKGKQALWERRHLQLPQRLLR